MTTATQHILMLAAENDVIPGAKVGGIGDVIRDAPRALAHIGQQVDVVIPAYGSFHRLAGAVKQGQVDVVFRQHIETVEIYELYQDETPGVRYWVMEHPLFSSCGVGQVYCSDPADNPFASDANKFALFSIAACEAITAGFFGEITTLHLHDWHTALIALIRAYDPAYAALQNIPCVFSIHNLALQGIRPLRDHSSSLEAWFPRLDYDAAIAGDPRWAECVNPVAAAIRLADRVHTVSPNYAQEIQLPSNEEQGFHGGEGLESDIQQAAKAGRLVGILNGCDYSASDQGGTVSWPESVMALTRAVRAWIASNESMRSSEYLADQWLRQREDAIESDSGGHPVHIVTSVGRLTHQKVGLLTCRNSQGQTVLDRLLQRLGNSGVFILLGTGEPEFEQFLLEAAVVHDNFLFLNRYAQSVADLLYANGTLFLMPSSFEPCGISQMIAMRHGQPCLVHAVGGLKDTVSDKQDGFHFAGSTVDEQADHLLQTFDDVLVMREQDPVQWQKVQELAAAARFEWRDSTTEYVEKLYKS